MRIAVKCVALIEGDQSQYFMQGHEGEEGSSPAVPINIVIPYRQAVTMQVDLASRPVQDFELALALIAVDPGTETRSSLAVYREVGRRRRSVVGLP